MEKNVVTKKVPINFCGEQFYAIRFDCPGIAMRTYADSKDKSFNWFTCLPISPLSYRKTTTYPTKAKCEVLHYSRWVSFLIFDDLGNLHKLVIHTSLSEDIQKIKDTLIQQELIQQ